MKKFAIAMALLLTLAPLSAGQTTRKRDVTLSQQSRANIRQAVAAVGLILVRGSGDDLPRPRGSGVIVKSDGVVVTNNHVIADEKPDKLFSEIFFALSEEGVAATSESKRYRLRPLLINREYDLALLRIESDSESMVFPAVEIGDSQAVKLLDDLTIIGFPEKGGSTVTISRGEVQGKDILGNWIKT
ncbi:MAG TPA: serine protease, partial [Blastocatellia bacterium]